MVFKIGKKPTKGRRLIKNAMDESMNFYQAETINLNRSLEHVEVPPFKN